MDPVTLWLLTEVVAPDAYSAIRQQVSERTSNERLLAAVREETDRREGRRYRRWLCEESTWADLAAPSPEAFERLVDSLTAAEAAGVIRRRNPDRGRAEELVRATIGHFLPTLDPSMAVAIADMRAGRRHNEVMARFDASSSYQDRESAMPPTARRVLAEDQLDRGAAEKLVYAVTGGDPRTVVAGLVREPPPWLADAPAQIALTIAETATAYGLRVEAGEMFEKAADLGRDRHWNYTRAAFEFAARGDNDRSTALLQRARSSESGLWADFVEAGLAQEWSKMIAIVPREDALAEPLTAAMYVEALLHTTGSDECIAFLTEAVERHPGSSGLLLRLAAFVLERSTRPGTTSRVQDQRSALELAERARDLRRTWRGPSGEAVELACHAALLADDYERVLELGTVAPDGVALADEAAEPEVQFAVAQAALALGRTEHASSIANAAIGFRHALVAAEVLLATSGAERGELATPYQRAWELVATEEEKVAFWLSASRAGVDPVPGADELQRRTDEIPSLVAAQLDVGHGRFQEAIDRLRPIRERETARRVLAGVYIQAGRVNDAVAELIDTANRFANPQHLVRAVELLIGDNRVDEAAQLATRALPHLASAPASVRALMHEAGVASAHNQGAWHDMEMRVRAWISDVGATSYTRWLLVQALYNQTEREAAWRVLHEAGALEPETAIQAALWVVLHARYRPGPDTLSKILALCERLPDDADLRTVAVNAFILTTDKGDLPPDELAQWQVLIRQRAEHPAEDDTFISVTLPDDPAGRAEIFRGFLEPQALQIQEMRENVRRGWPYAMLAGAAGRTYTAALIHRAMGYLAPFTMDGAIRNNEQEVAAAAINGPVLVDLSTLAVGWFIRERWPQLTAAFVRVALTSAARRDVGAAADGLRPRPSESLGWDLTASEPVRFLTPPEQLDRLEAHIDWMEHTARTLTIRDWPAPDSRSRLDGQEDGLASWLGALELVLLPISTSV